MKDIHVLMTHPATDYALLDSGAGEKLERYGKIILARPDPQALWYKGSPALWNAAQAVFSRVNEKAGWKINADVPDRWQISLADLNFWIKPTSFKHTGLFPEQVPNWNWIRQTIKDSDRKVSVLNLFGYTGGASLAAAQAGADVCHVDGSKTSVTWARENAEISGLKDAPIRWILDDARAFVRREIKRGNKYDAIIMDPPAFGRGPDGETWNIEEDFLDLLALCKQVLTPNPLFIIINGYASGYSAIAYENNLSDMMRPFKGAIEIGELTIETEGSKRLLPAGIFARWKAD